MKILGRGNNSYIIEISEIELKQLTEITDERRLQPDWEVNVGAIYNRLDKLRMNERILRQYAEQLRGIATLLEPLDGHIKDACEGGGK